MNRKKKDPSWWDDFVRENAVFLVPLVFAAFVSFALYIDLQLRMYLK